MKKLFSKKQNNGKDETKDTEDKRNAKVEKKHTEEKPIKKVYYDDKLPKYDPITHLPMDLMITLFSILDDNSLGSAARVSKAWKT